MAELINIDKRPFAVFSPQKAELPEMRRPAAAKENSAMEEDKLGYIFLFIMQGSVSKLLRPRFEDDAHSVTGTVVKGQVLFTDILQFGFFSQNDLKILNVQCFSNTT